MHRVVRWATLSVLVFGAVAVENHHCRDLVGRGIECLKKNIVIRRSDGYGASMSPEPLWSLRNLDCSEGRTCGDPTELLKSLHDGIRGVEGFVPHGCKPDWLTGDHACFVFSSYDAVILVGDSLTRHTFQGLHILLRSDARYGGIPARSSLDFYNSCACDGQFSEDGACRVDVQNQLSFDDVRTGALCPATRPFALRFIDIVRTPVDIPVCLYGNERRVLVFMAGGTHVMSNANVTRDTLLVPMTQKTRRAAGECGVRVYIVWAGLGVQVREMDAQYPHQSREAARIFNEVISRAASDNGVDFMDVWELTRDAPSSDGFHHLTDVNLIRALYVVNLAKMRGGEVHM